MAELFNTAVQYSGQRPKKSKRFAVIGLIVGLLTIPIAILFLNQQQEVRQRAQVGQNGTHDTCGKLTITVSENPTCPRVTDFINGTCQPKSPPVTNNIASYKMAIQITAVDGKQHTINYTSHNNFCNIGHGVTGGNACICVQNDQPVTTNFTVPGTITLSRSSPNGTACGTYQMDFSINSVDGNTSCKFVGQNSGTQGAFGFCETGTNCSATTPTPTPKPTNTPTPKPSATPTPKPSNTPTPTPCVTPGKVANVKVVCPNCSS